MSVPPRHPAPSAIDGVRRLQRTRSATAAPVDAEAPTRRTRRRPRRLVGSLRILGALGVVAIIAGTSYGIATTSPTGARTDRAASRASVSASASTSTAADVPSRARATSATAAAPVAAKPGRNAASRSAAQARANSAAADEVRTQAIDAATATAGPVRAPQRELPLTGVDELAVLRAMLAGATLVLVGMLAQIAGTPLPAQSARRRLASRST